MAGILEKIKQKVLRTSSKVDQYQEAITFAEAGESEHALGLMQEQPESIEIHKLLVVGQEGTFSRDMIDYALDMAKRMSYDIVALNTAPLSCGTIQLFSSSRDQLCTDFQELSTKNAEIFEKEMCIEFTEHPVIIDPAISAMKLIDDRIVVRPSGYHVHNRLRQQMCVLKNRLPDLVEIPQLFACHRLALRQIIDLAINHKIAAFVFDNVHHIRAKFYPLSR